MTEATGSVIALPSAIAIAGVGVLLVIRPLVLGLISAGCGPPS